MASLPFASPWLSLALVTSIATIDVVAGVLWQKENRVKRSFPRMENRYNSGCFGRFSRDWI